MLSDLGLTQAEVESIMTDITGQASTAGDALPRGAVWPTVLPLTKQPSVNVAPSVSVAPPKPAISPTKTADAAPPMLKQAAPTAAKSVQTKAKAPTAVGPIVVGATTGLILGGPPGAAIGAGTMWLLSKVIKPKTPPQAQMKTQPKTPLKR